MRLTAAASAHSIIGKVFGRRLGDIEIRTWARSDRGVQVRAAGRRNAALTLGEASIALLHGIEIHNASRGLTRPPEFSIGRQAA